MAVNRLIYALILVLSIAATQMYAGHFSSVLLITVIAAPLVSLIIALIQLAALKVQMDSRAEMPVRGENLKVRIPITDRFILPLSTGVLYASMPASAEQKDIRMIFSLPPLKTRSFNIVFGTKHRGEYTLTLDKAAVYDMFGIFRLTKKLGLSKKVTVLPKIFSVSGDDKRLVSQSDDTNLKAINSTAGEKSYVRKYTDGDDIKRIHWKLSSKQEDYMVWQHTKGQDDSVAVFCDLKGFGNDPDAREDYSDLTLESSLAAMLFAVKREMQTVLCCYNSRENGTEYFPVSSTDGVFDAAVMTAGLETYDDGPELADIARESFDGYRKYSAVILVTPVMDEKLYAVIKNLSEEHRVSVLLTEVSEESKAALGRLGGVKAACISPDCSEEKIAEVVNAIWDN